MRGHFGIDSGAGASASASVAAMPREPYHTTYKRSAELRQFSGRYGEAEMTDSKRLLT